MKYQVTMGFKVTVGGGADAASALEAHLDSVMDELAIHAAQGSTPGWPTFTELEAHAAVLDHADPLASLNA